MSLAGLDREAATFILESTRVTGMVLAAPFLWSSAPMRTRGALVLLVGFLCHGKASLAAAPLDSVAQVAVAAPTELLIGVALGLVVRMTIATVEIAGDLMSPLIGFGAASLFDPQAQIQETGLTRILRMLSVILALSLGIHRLLLGSVIASFHVIPAGAVVDVGLALPELLRISSGTIATGVRLSMPVVATLLLTQLGLAFISRAAPSLQIFSIGFAISLVVGTLVIVTSLPELAREIEVDLSRTGERVEMVLLAMGRG